MPRLSRPASMPLEVQRVIEIFGNAARTEILRQVSIQSEPRSAPELAALLGLHRATLHQHLVALEEAGLVRADHDPGQRRGRTIVRWEAVPAQIDKLGERWVKYAKGE